MPDLIPPNDEDFSVFMTTFVNYVAAHAVAVGVAAGTATALSAALLDFTDSLTAHQTAQTAALSARATKDTKRVALTELARPAIQMIQANPAVTDEVRTLMALPIRDATRTRVAVPTTRPVGQVDTSQRLQHTISWRDESAPNSKAKPAGVRGPDSRAWLPRLLHPEGVGSSPHCEREWEAEVYFYFDRLGVVR
jgi:hypothetical protein